MFGKDFKIFSLVVFAALCYFLPLLPLMIGAVLMVAEKAGVVLKS